MDFLDDEEYYEEDGSEANGAPRLDEATQLSEDAGNSADVGMPLDEFIAQLGAWGSAMEESMQQTMWESALEAEKVEHQLQEPPAPPDLMFAEIPAPMESSPLLGLSEEEPLEHEARQQDSSLEEVNAFLAEIAAEARVALQDERNKLLSRGEPSEVVEVAEELLQHDVREQVTLPTSPAEGLADQVPDVEDLLLQTGPDLPSDSAQALRSIEDKRLACLQELEREHEAFVEQMRQEEEDIRCEQARVQEEVRMHREELCCREFYREEAAAQWRERRKMSQEDRCGRHVREEERHALENAERAKEAAERQRLAAEDMLAAAIRRRDHEVREAASMLKEDASSAALREVLRLAAEIERFAAADAESFLWRERCQEAAETQLMVVEEQRSCLLRLCEAKAVLEFDQQEATNVVRPVFADLSVLTQMVMPGSSNQVKRDETRGAPWPSCSNSCALNPWDSCQVTESIPKGDQNVKARTCGCLMCLQLWEGNSRCRGKASSRKRPPKPWSRPPDPKSEPKQPTGRLVSEDLGLDGLAAGLDEWTGSATDLVRLEIRMEGLEQLPAVSKLPELRILALSGNKIASLEALHGCPKLEELVLDQNALTSLDGLRHLRHLSVLKATMNAITDAEDLAQLPQLRVVDLSKNRLTSVHLRAKGLAKLVLYRNSLDSTSFLQELPSLTHLDLGRNKLTELDFAISEWTPVLAKAFLYENRMVSLPELHLPLLTDLWVDSNLIEQLGPLGFLPSLERLQAKHNRIRKLSFPIAASPLLKTLELAFNQLESSEPQKAVVAFARLTRLQLNDNPVAAELMEAYRPWVLRMAPQLEELDNETVAESERRELDLLGFGRGGHASKAALLTERTAALSQKRLVNSAPAPSGLLGLVNMTDLGCRRQTQHHVVDRKSDAVGRGPSRRVQQAMVDRWKAGWAKLSDVSEDGGCSMCALAAWCEMLNTARSAPLVAHTRDERRTAASLSSSGTQKRSRGEALFALQRRHDFWTAYLQLCFGQHDSLMPWRKHGVICRTAAFEMQIPGSERSRQALILKVQSRWRGFLARRAFSRLCLERVCEAMSLQNRQRFVQLQALWRGHSQRNALRARGMAIPGDKRWAKLEHAATQLQAALRGSRVRRKLRWAKEVSKMVSDDLEDCPEVDLEEMLSEARSVANADPFSSLRLPPLKEIAGPQALSEHRQKPEHNLGPKVAWAAQNTPQGVSGGGALPTGDTASEGGSVAGSPHSSRPGSGFGVGPRRSKSLSSTAESAMTEPDGHGARTRVEQAKDEWGFQDLSTARACLAAQKRRQPRPPTLPGHGPLRSAGRQPAANVARRQQSSQSAGPSKRAGGCQKAQDAIAEYRRLQEAEATSASGAATEFRTGSPNRKLMRSSQSLG